MPVRAFSNVALAALCVSAAVAVAADPQPVAPKILLVAGLTIIGAHHEKDRDYERVERVIAASADSVTALHRLEINSILGTAPKWAQKVRTVARADLDKSLELNACYRPQDPEAMPGVTDFQASAAVLDALKTQGKTAFTYIGGSAGVGLAAEMGTLRCTRFVGTLKRVGPGSEPFPLLFNGQRVTVQTVHARGYLETADGDGERFEFWFLDDPANALWLNTTSDLATTNFQVVRIDAMDTAPPLAALAGKDCRAELHGVYFGSGSAALLPESSGALAAIAAVLKAHPGWKVTVEGHTDSLGGAAPNLDLSTRRAVAVLDALVATDGVPAAQLTTQGFGLAKPVDSNDTPEGRAHNRRVELARKCP